MINLDYIFPTPVWWADIDVDVREIQSICYEIAASMPSKSRTNRGAKNYQSPDFLAETVIEEGSVDDELAKALTQIKSLANEAFSSYGSFATTLRFANVWININNAGGYNETHTHPGAVMSGVLYVRVPQEGDAGHLCFHRNPIEAYAIQSLGIAEDFGRADVPHGRATHTYAPREGRLILFPAWISHGVRENSTTEDRISISFNLIPNRNKRNLLGIIKAHDGSENDVPQTYKRKPK
jgi:uncharacterized protein (TIGR02466 family)